MQMRPSRVLKKLRAGKIATCTKINLSDPAVPEVAAMHGFDCLWLDTEHVPNDWATIKNQIRAAKLHDVDTLVRVTRGSYSDHIRPLEADAAGIMVPHLMSLADAKKVVWNTRFAPIGRRPIDGGGTDGAYCMMPIDQYVVQANDQRFVIVQIEDPEPMVELEEIAALDGIDIIFFGPGDFSHGSGILGQWDHPKMSDARKRIADVANANGKVAASVCAPAKLQELVDLGYRFISMGADVVGLATYYKDLFAAFQSICR